MASDLPRPRKRSRNSHHPDAASAEKSSLELEKRCQDHIRSLLFPEDMAHDDGSSEGVDWLKQETIWPLELKQKVHRFMHERNVYELSKPNDSGFADLVEMVKSQAAITSITNWEQEVPDKCMYLMNTSTKSWKREGFLVTRNNVTRKSKVFQFLWDCAIRATHTRSPTKSIDLAIIPYTASYFQFSPRAEVEWTNESVNNLAKVRNEITTTSDPTHDELSTASAEDIGILPEHVNVSQRMTGPELATAPNEDMQPIEQPWSQNPIDNRSGSIDMLASPSLFSRDFDEGGASSAQSLSLSSTQINVPDNVHSSTPIPPDPYASSHHTSQNENPQETSQVSATAPRHAVSKGASRSPRIPLLVPHSYSEPNTIDPLYRRGVYTKTVKENGAVVLGYWNEMGFIHLATSMQRDIKTRIRTPRRLVTRRFSAEDVLNQPIETLFRWVARILHTDQVLTLLFEFSISRETIDRKFVLHQEDPEQRLVGGLRSITARAWEYREMTNMDTESAEAKIQIIPVFSATFTGLHEDTSCQLQRSGLKGPVIRNKARQPAKQPSDQRYPSSASDSGQRSATTRTGVPPTLPPPQPDNTSSGSPASDNIEPIREHSVSTLDQTPDQQEQTIAESSMPPISCNASDFQAVPAADPGPPHPSQHQAAQTPSPETSKTSTYSTARIVVRLQVDGLGRLSRGHDNSVLNTETTITKFFSWFEQETGHTASEKLRFDFKDAVPAKSSLIERSNDDHFDLMVCDIKRKFERAKKFVPDMTEFAIVVTDPWWESGDEEDEEEDD